MLCWTPAANVAQTLYWLPVYHVLYHHIIMNCVLVHLNVDVDVANEFQGCGKRDRSEHEKEDVAGEESVAEELDGLQCAWHVRSLEVVEQCVEKHKHARWPAHASFTVNKLKEEINTDSMPVGYSVRFILCLTTIYIVLEMTTTTNNNNIYNYTTTTMPTTITTITTTQQQQ